MASTGWTHPLSDKKKDPGFFWRGRRVDYPNDDEGNVTFLVSPSRVGGGHTASFSRFLSGPKVFPSGLRRYYIASCHVRSSTRPSFLPLASETPSRGRKMNRLKSSTFCFLLNPKDVALEESLGETLPHPYLRGVYLSVESFLNDGVKRVDISRTDYWWSVLTLLHY